MILEIDAGNSYIKWRRYCELTGLGGPVQRAATPEDIGLSAERYGWCRMVSVRSGEETDRIVASVSDRFSIDVALLTSGCTHGRLRNGYHDWGLLGADRWACLLAAYDLSGGPALVIDMGTAITADVIDSTGLHVGGFIAPGPMLMRRQLLTGTDLVKLESVAPMNDQALAPGTDTATALVSGCLLMAKAYVKEQIELVVSEFGPGVKIYLTGGDAPLVVSDPRVIHLPDLVFRGLAIGLPSQTH